MGAPPLQAPRCANDRWSSSDSEVVGPELVSDELVRTTDTVAVDGEMYPKLEHLTILT